MFIELAGIVMGSVTVITVASLRLVKTVYQDEHDDEPVRSDVVVEPFQSITDATTCIVCGCAGKGTRGGPQCPDACRRGEKCPAYGRAHLHVQCNSCGSHWFMKTARG
jgi:hypothetical protein